MTDETRDLSKELQAAQGEARQARCEAFVDYAPTVAGETLRPVTLNTYNALIAFRNAFAVGGDIGFEDVANFVWLHHPRFSQFNRKEKAAVTRRVFRALRPGFPTVNASLRVLCQFPRLSWLRGFTTESEGERFTAAVGEIRRLMREATGDLPCGDEEGEPMPFAFQAHILNTFRRTLGASFEETSALPMKQLAQHLREILHHASNGKAILLTRAEAAIWIEDSKRREAELNTRKTNV